MKNRINTAKSRLFASHELYSVVKDQDYQVLVIDAEIDTFGVTIILSLIIHKYNQSAKEPLGHSVQDIMIHALKVGSPKNYINNSDGFRVKNF